MPRKILILLWITSSLIASVARANSERGALVKFVIVTRHGVRSPLPKPAELNQWSTDPWPAWPVKEGEMTPRGKQLVTLEGRYYRDLLDADGAFASGKCPAKSNVFVWADTDQRTKETGRGLLDGIAPGCGLEAHWSPVELDPLFRPLAAKSCPIDPDLARAAILGRTGNDLDAIVDADRGALDALQTIMHCCKADLCGTSNSCALPSLGTQIVLDHDSLRMKGALGIAATASEIFLLEYGQGFPASQVGWGRADEARMVEALRFHTLQFDLMFRTPYLAARGGSRLMHHVLMALDDRIKTGVSDPSGAPGDAAVVIFVGHDTNIANLGAMLDASWQLPGYPPNYTAPGGALIFELWRGKDGGLRVYSSYLAQTLGQLRAMTPLSLKSSPARSPLFIAACSSAEADYPCKLDDFVRAARASIVPACATAPSGGSPAAVH
jgi:4-phytase/acid phosphatase